MSSKVSQIGCDAIRSVAKPVDFPLSSENLEVVSSLVSQMREAELVGMAAPQIGRSVRIFVTEVRKTRFRNRAPDELRVFLNPEILYYSAKTEIGYEGCGSVAETNLFGEVERATSVQIRWQNEEGAPFEGTFEGFLARIVQHEYDHLNGIVFLDRLATTKTVLSATEFQKRLERDGMPNEGSKRAE
ncbi:MAG: peptide deformylase [Micropepsaceae bacterium]